MASPGKSGNDDVLMSAEEIYAVGMKYLLGDGLEKDEVEAAHWIGFAAEKGLPLARARLGNMYLQGQGVEKDYGRAFDFLMSAANGGVPMAMMDLGLMYANGAGVQQNLVIAADCLIRSFENGGGKSAAESILELREALLERKDDDPEGIMALVGDIDARLPPERLMSSICYGAPGVL